MEETSTKNELCSDLDKEWAHIERIFSSLSEADMLTPGVEGEWSVKDILCHLSAWEKYLLDRLGYVLTRQHPLYPVMSTWDDVHRFTVFEQDAAGCASKCVGRQNSISKTVVSNVAADGCYSHLTWLADLRQVFVMDGIRVTRDGVKNLEIGIRVAEAM